MPRKKKTKYGVSGLAWLKLTPELVNKSRLRHIAFIIEAHTKTEAFGIAWALVRKVYPSDSHEDHSVVITPDDKVTKLETFDGVIS